MSRVLALVLPLLICAVDQAGAARLRPPERIHDARAIGGPRTSREHARPRLSLRRVVRPPATSAERAISRRGRAAPTTRWLGPIPLPGARFATYLIFATATNSLVALAPGALSGTAQIVAHGAATFGALIVGVLFNRQFDRGVHASDPRYDDAEAEDLR